jgi:hypothetical protein
MARTNRNTRYKGELKKQAYVDYSRLDNLLLSEIEEGLLDYEQEKNQWLKPEVGTKDNSPISNDSS